MKILATLVMCWIGYNQLAHNLIDTNLQAPLWQHIVFEILPFTFMIWFIWRPIG